MKGPFNSTSRSRDNRFTVKVKEFDNVVIYFYTRTVMLRLVNFVSCGISLRLLYMRFIYVDYSNIRNSLFGRIECSLNYYYAV